MTLQRYLTRLAWLSTLPLLALALGLSVLRLADRRADEDGHASRLAERLAHDVDHELQARINALRVLARSPLLGPSRWPDLHDAALGFHDGFGGAVVVVDADRRALVASRAAVGDGVPTVPAGPGVPIATDARTVDAAFASGRPAVGDPVASTDAGEIVVAIAVPAVEGSGGVPYVVVNAMPVRRLDALFADVPIPAGWSATVRDSQGVEAWRRAGDAQPPAGSAEAPSMLGYAARPAVAPWAVEVAIPRAGYLQSLGGVGAGLLAMLLAAIVTSVVIGHRGRQRLGRSVGTLARVDGPGDESDAADEIDEFREARRLIAQTIAQRRAADDALAVSEGQLRGIFESATEAIVTADAQQRIVLANPAAARTFGWTVDELVGAPLERLIPPRFRAAHRDEVERFGRSHAATRAMGRRADVVGLRADGSEFPIEAAISQVHVDGHHLYTVILRDVTERRRHEAAVAGANARLEAAIEGMHDGLLMIGNDGRVVEVNSAYARLCGFDDRHECVGMVADCERLLDVRTLDGQPVPPGQRASARALRGEIASGVEWQVRRAGEGAWWVGSFGFAPVSDPGGHGLGAVVTVRDVTERRRLEQELQASHAELAGLMAAQVTAEEGERRRIARELHDELQQVLAAIKMDAAAIEAELRAEGGRATAIAARIDDLATAAIVSSRRIVNDLRPLLLEELGLVAALRDLARQAGERSHVAITVEEHPTLRGQPAPPEAVAICLYRIAQEALNNIAKHAGARRVRIVLSSPTGGGWRLTITDDGRGMRPEDWRKPGSHGLRGMHERVRGLGGTLRIDGEAGRGVSITVECPADAATGPPPV